LTTPPKRTVLIPYIMDLETFIINFEEAVEDVESGTLAGDTAFRDLKSWDSLAVLTVTDMIDYEYGVSINKNDFQGVHTIRDVYDCIRSKGQLK